METPDDRPTAARAGLDCARDAAGLIFAWGTWAALTIAMVFYVRQNTRNVPYWDEFAMIPVMAGAQSPTLEWAWSQHNEHRPVLSRLIMAGLFRLDRDFRIVRYANAALFSAMAAAMLILARRLRGSSRMIDLILPMAILNLAQAECLVNGFAMNLILSSMIAVALIAATGLGRGGPIAVGLALVLLPLCGGSGLAMLPPLALWLSGSIGWGWWSGTRPGARDRTIGLGLLAAVAVLVALYLRDFERPTYLSASSTITQAASATLMCLSLAIHPRIQSYAWPAGASVAAILVATIALLLRAGWRSPRDRPRAFGLLAVLLSLVGVAAAVAVSRASLGADRIMSSRYVTLTTPLLGVVYTAWLAYGRPRVRGAVHLVLLLTIVLAIPNGRRFARQYGTFVRDVERRVERRLLDHAPTAVVLKLVYPDFQGDRDLIVRSFRMLGAARVGAFAGFEPEPMAAAPSGATRR